MQSWSRTDSRLWQPSLQTVFGNVSMKIVTESLKKTKKTTRGLQKILMWLLEVQQYFCTDCSYIYGPNNWSKVQQISMYLVCTQCVYAAIYDQLSRQDKMLAVTWLVSKHHIDIPAKCVISNSIPCFWPDCHVRRWRGWWWSYRRVTANPCSRLLFNIYKCDTTLYF